jgi:hypothetical protein
MVSKKYRKVLGHSKAGTLWDVGKHALGRGSYEKGLKFSVKKSSPTTQDPGGREE